MENKKKVLFLCQYFFPEKISSGILPFELASELVENNYDVYALVGYPKEYYDGDPVKKKELYNGIHITRFRYPQFNRKNKIGRVFNYLSFCIFLLFHLRNFKDVDFCFSYTNPPLLPFFSSIICKKKHIKLIITIYDLYPDAAIKANILRSNSIISKMINMANDFSYRHCWKIIVLSSECKEYLMINKKINKDKVVVIPNWYKDDSSSFPVQHDKLTIIYGGNMGIMQDMNSVLTLILLLKNEKNVEFILAGHGNKKEIIENELKINNVKNCSVYGFLPKEQYDALMNKADIAIVSLEQFAVGLGSPSKVYGYLCKGLPIIAILSEKMEICQDIIQYKCGYHYTNKNKNEIIKKIIDLAKDKDKLDNLKKNAISLYKIKYSLDVVKSKYIKLLNE